MRALIPAAVAFLLATFLPVTANADNGQERTWNFDQATIPGAQAAGNWGEGVTVAVIDTWVDFNHPGLKGRIAGHAVCINSASGCRDQRYDKDQCTHGTHVAGTVVSGRYGVAPRADVLAVQVLAYDRVNNSCGGTTDDVARAIEFAVGKGVQVINLSLGSQVPGVFTSKAVDDAVAAAAKAGVVVVFAAGNRTIPISDDYGSDAVIVAATGPDGSIASYSTRGGAVSLAAPGGDDGAAGLRSCSRENCILSTVPGTGYGLLEGTSMAAPHVSGVAALLLSQLPGRGRDDVLTSLRSTARDRVGTRDGLIDATAALALRKGAERPPATMSTTPDSVPNGAASQSTRQERPPADQPAVRDPGPGAGSRSVTFPRATRTSSVPGDERPQGTIHEAGPPDGGGAGPGDDGSGLPMMVVWGGLATAGVIGVLSAVGRRRLFGDHDE